MSLWDTIKSFFGGKSSKPFAQPFKPGQFVCYVMESADGPNEFLQFTVAQEIAGDFLVIAERKSDKCQYFAALRIIGSHYNMNSEMPGMPLGFGLRFGDEESEEGKMGPTNLLAHAMNTLNSPNFAQKEEAQAIREPVKVPAGQFNCISAEDPWPEFGYTKTHWISEQIPVTGLVRSLIQEVNHNTICTAYGVNNPGILGTVEVLDFGYVSRLDHGRFTLSYPGTWFMGENVADHVNEMGGDQWTEAFMLTHGGNTAALSMGIMLLAGTEAEVSERRKTQTTQFAEKSPDEGYSNRIVTELEKSTRIAQDFEDESKLGYSYASIITCETGKRIAVLTFVLLTSKHNPLIKSNLEKARELFSEIADSFEWNELKA